MLGRLRQAWRTAEHPFLARLGGLGTAAGLVTAMALVFAGIVGGLINLVSVFPTWIVVIIVVGTFVGLCSPLAALVAAVRSAKALPSTLRDFGRRLSSDYAARIATAPPTLPQPPVQTGAQTAKQERYRIAWRKSQDRRRRHFGEVEASYAQSYRVEAIALYERAVAAGAVPDEAERIEFRQRIAHPWQDQIANIADLFETLADRTQATPLRKRLRS